MARRLLVLTAAALFVITAACGTDEDALATKEDKSDAAADDGTTSTDPKTPRTKRDKDRTEDEGDNEDATERETESETEDDTGGDGSDPEFCRLATELDDLFVDLDANDYQGYADAIDDAGPIIADYIDRLPDDLKDEGQVLSDAIEQLGRDLSGLEGDPDAETKAAAAFEKVDSPEVNAAGDATDAYEEQVCGES